MNQWLYCIKVIGRSTCTYMFAYHYQKSLDTVLTKKWATTWQKQQNECAPSEDSDQLSIRPVWSVFAVRIKKAWVLSYPLSAQWRLIRLGGCPGWSESSLDAKSLCWFCHVAAQSLDAPFCMGKISWYAHTVCIGVDITFKMMSCAVWF